MQLPLTHGFALRSRLHRSLLLAVLPRRLAVRQSGGDRFVRRCSRALLLPQELLLPLLKLLPQLLRLRLHLLLRPPQRVQLLLPKRLALPADDTHCTMLARLTSLFHFI